jgi:hypothetical protein
MPDKYIEESLGEAKDYINKIETHGEPMINIAERILHSCKSFMHPPHNSEYESYIKKIDTEFDIKLRDAKEKNDKESDSFLKYYNMAQFVLNLRVEKLTRVINYLDTLNKKL